MPFPDATRVIYDKNPLDRVICQVRFPSILGIDANPPADFQDKIRAEFPEFREKDEPQIILPRKIQSEFPQDIIRQLMPSDVKNYEFASADNNWCVNLTRTFLSLSAKIYTRRSEFQGKLSQPLAALNEIYRPSYFSRIGLRYIDIIDRSELNLRNVPWKDLLQPRILGLLGANEINQEIHAAECKYEIQLDDRGNNVRIITKLVTSDDNEERFVIDSDFFRSVKTDINNVIETLNFFHETAFRLMRWLITDRLHNAMEPRLI
jgi:uncharacterized protein (TIGR04255 family)